MARGKGEKETIVYVCPTGIVQQRFITVPHSLLLLTESPLFPFSSEDLPIDLGQSVWSFTKELHGLKVVGQYPEGGCILEL